MFETGIGDVVACAQIERGDVSEFGDVLEAGVGY